MDYIKIFFAVLKKIFFAGLKQLYSLDKNIKFVYNNLVTRIAGIAQLVEQRIRNAQVACSSHVSSSKLFRLPGF